MTNPTQPTGHYPELLTDLAIQVGVLLKNRNVDPSEADLIGLEVAEHVRNHWGGQMIYIQKGLSHDTRLKWQRIWDEFTGDNVKELATRHDLTEVQVYRIIKVMRAEHTRKTQLSLIDTGDGDAH